MTAREALAAAFAGLIHNQDDGTYAADRALGVLRGLPVDDRMVALGMVPCDTYDVFENCPTWTEA